MSFNFFFSLCTWFITWGLYSMLFYKLGVKRDWHKERIRQFLSSKKSSSPDLKQSKFKKHEMIYKKIYVGLRFKSTILSTASYIIFALLYPLHIFENPWNYVQFLAAVVFTLTTFCSFTFSAEDISNENEDENNRYKNLFNAILKDIKSWVIEDKINLERDYFNEAAINKIENTKRKKNSDYIGTLIYKLSNVIDNILTDNIEKGIEEKIREDLYDIIDYYLNNEEVMYVHNLKGFINYIYTAEGINIVNVNNVFDDERISLLNRSEIEPKLKRKILTRRTNISETEINNVSEILNMFNI